MSDSKKAADIRAKHSELKKELRSVQRDYSKFLDTAKTGPEYKTQKEFYERQKEKAAKALNTFESKNDLDKYKMKPSKDLKMPKKLSGKGGGGGGILTPGGNSSGLQGLPKGMTRKMNKGGMAKKKK